jgi:16S rRNA (cytidine1402-2'-O)-methyltransferase
VPGTLWLVGTPIGNLEDVTDRARRVLSEVGLIACEDTRRTGRLLERLGIERAGTRLISFFEGNEERRVPELLAVLREGSDVAMVTDAGMPGVSDPGYRLVAACVEAGIPVDVAPGPSAAVAALVISGFPTDRFAFEGFLPRSGRARRVRLEAIASEPRTTVLFESPKRVGATLAELPPSRRVAVVRELTKLHQEVIRGPAAELAEHLRSREPKGEVVIVVEGDPRPQPDLEEAVRIATDLVQGGSKKREASRQASARTGIPAAEIYARLVDR